MEQHYIKDFWELNVYQRLRVLRNTVISKIIPKLPKVEKFDLGSQMSRASKAACALLAEGFAKRFQKVHWNRYLTDVVGECNEMIDHLSVIEDNYKEFFEITSIQRVTAEYKIAIRQLTKLGSSWRKHHNKKAEH